MTQVINISRTLGDSALKLGKSSEAIAHLKSYVVLLEIHVKFKIISDTKAKGHSYREQGLVKLLELNKTLLDVHNKLSVACFRSSEYHKSFLFFVCAIFIYNNSLRMIDQSDPLKYPKKNTNEVLMKGNELKDNSIFSRSIQGFNESYKKALENYEAVWKIVEKNPTKFRQEFFQAVKDSMDYLHQSLSYTKREYTQYISQALQGKHETHSLDKSTKKILDSYQENYIGRIEPYDIDEFVDVKIQAVVKTVVQAVNKNQACPYWVAESLGSNMSEYQRGKLNKAKIKLYFEFVSMDLEMMAEIMMTSIYNSHKGFVQTNENRLVHGRRLAIVLNRDDFMLGKEIEQDDSRGRLNPADPISPKLNSPRGLRSKFVSQRSNSFSFRKKIEKTDLASVPLILRLLKIETQDEFFSRIVTELPTSMFETMNSNMTYFKKKFLVYARLKKMMAENDSHKRNMEGDKLKQRLQREELNPDLKIGIYLRQLSSINSYRPPYRNSRFFKEKAHAVQMTKEYHSLAEYRDRHQPLVNMDLTNDLPENHIKPRTERIAVKDKADLLNLIHDTSAYYEDLNLKRNSLKKNLKRNTNKVEVKEMSILSSHSRNKVDKSIVSLKNIESSLPEINKLVCTLTVENLELSSISFDIGQDKVSFVLTFRQSDLKTSSTTFYLRLSQDLWILKEKMMLRSKPELIKTYLPVIFDILLKEFFGPVFSTPSRPRSVTPDDLNQVENLKRLMGLKYPIEMTRLASYDVDYLRAIPAFSEAMKADFDSMQALRLIMSYLATVIRTASKMTPSGVHTVRYINMGTLATNRTSSVRLINSLFMLQFKSASIYMAFKDYAREKFTYVVNSSMLEPVDFEHGQVNSTKILKQLERLPEMKLASSGTRLFLKLKRLTFHQNPMNHAQVLLQSFTAMLDKLYHRSKLVTKLNNMNQTTRKKVLTSVLESEVEQSNSVFVNHLNRQIFIDEYGRVNFIDLNIKVEFEELKKNIERIQDLFLKLSRSLNKSKSASHTNGGPPEEMKNRNSPIEIVRNEVRAAVMVYFLVLNRCVSFQVTINSPFKDKYYKGYRKQVKPSISQDSKKLGIKRLVLEVSKELNQDAFEDYISVVELYQILDSKKRSSMDQNQTSSSYYSGNGTKTAASSINETPFIRDLNDNLNYNLFILMEITSMKRYFDYVNILAEHILNKIKTQQHLALAKDRTFYEIALTSKDQSISIHNTYRYKYSDKVAVNHSILKKLREIILGSSEESKVTTKVHGDFLLFYELVCKDNIQAEKGLFIGKAKHETGIDSIRAVQSEGSSIEQSKLITQKAKKLNERTNLEDAFNRNFEETIQHISKKSGVISVDSVQRSSQGY
jgi:hypothetical protein